jgi:predicted nucleotidyltransferase
MKVKLRQKKYEKPIQEFLSRVENFFGNGIIFLSLYGSVAKGGAKEDSDIDIFAVVKNKKMEEKIDDVAYDVGLKHDTLFTIITITPGELRRLKELESIYLEEVCKTGVVLYGKRETIK